MSLPLEGIRVLDLSRGVAASFCTLVLAEYGAEVIKVESPDGDMVRGQEPLEHGMGAVFTALNRNKRSIVLNLKDDKERDKFLKLAATADVVVENYRPGVMESLDLSYGRLAELNRRLIVCSVSAFGQSGEWSKKAAHEINILGLSGMLKGLCDADGNPVLPVTHLAAMVGGSMWALVGILLALIERGSSGSGMHLDVGILHGIQSIMAPEILTELISGEEQVSGKAWNSGPTPSNCVYRTRDGKWITFAPMEAKYWSNFCELFEADNLAEAGFPHGERAKWVKTRVGGIIGSLTLEEFFEKASEKEIMAEPMLGISEALKLRPVKQKGTVFLIKNREGKLFTQLKLPLSFSAPCPENPPPEKGEHDGIYLTQLAERDDLKTILIVYHSQGGATESMARAFAKGASKVSNVRVKLMRASEATAGDLLECKGLAIGSPEYFGYMAGQIKDFFDRTYDEIGDRTFRLPYVTFVCAGNDGRGTIAGIERIAAGYKWKKVADSARVVGAPNEKTFMRLEELGETLAAGVEMGIY